MKVTAKLARFNFDQRALLEYLDINRNDQIELHKLFSVLADKLCLYFSIGEQIAIRNALFPGSQNESVTESRTRIVNLKGKSEQRTKTSELIADQVVIADKQERGKHAKHPTKRDRSREARGSRPFTEVMITTQADYVKHLSVYMVRLPEFIEYVMFQWHEYIKSLSGQIERSFADYDAYHQRNALNFEQLSQILAVDLRVTLQSCHGTPADSSSLEGMFIDALQNIETNEEFQEEGLLGIEAVKKLILEQNADLIPFQKYVSQKYGNAKI